MAKVADTSYQVNDSLPKYSMNADGSLKYTGTSAGGQTYTTNLYNNNGTYMTSKPTATTTPTSSVADNSSLLSNYYKQQNEAARQSALESLAKRLNLNISQYEDELGNLNNNYQKLVNQSEVDRYKSKAALREASANRGQLDTGYGRQLALQNDLNYSAQKAGILNQAESDRQTIRNAIASLKADYESDKATIENQYNNALLQLMSE